MSKIEWTDSTINPIVGCSKVSRACDNCYAADTAFNIEFVLPSGGKAKPRKNYAGVSRKDQDGRPNWTGVVNYDPTVMQRLSPNQSPKRFFVNSMSDFFHPKVRLEWLKEIFGHFARCPQHTFLILTKRPEQALAWAHELDWHPNVWLGATVESDQPKVMRRVDHLREVPAARRFLSCEPLTGDVAAKLDLTGIDWVIVGGETVNKNTPPELRWKGVEQMRLEHALALKDLCDRSGTPYFFKQWGAFAANGVKRFRSVHGEGLAGKVHHSWPTDATDMREELRAIRWSGASCEPGMVKLIATGAPWLPDATFKVPVERSEIEDWMAREAPGQFHSDKTKGIAFLTPNAAFYFKMRFAR